MWIPLLYSSLSLASATTYITLFETKSVNRTLDNDCYTLGSLTHIWCITEEKQLGENLIHLEEDGYASGDVCIPKPPYHLKRIKSRKIQNVLPFSAPSNIRTVNVYVVDTLVDVDHKDFNNRAEVVYTTRMTGNYDHGTHVAGLVNSPNYGVNSKARILSVQVLDDNGMTRWSEVIRAFDFISKDYRRRRMPAVINLSLSGTPSRVLDKAIEELFKQGILTVVAAGNDFRDACMYSPARAPYAITVAASTSENYHAFFSNFGRCVDIYAPGENILSTLPNDKHGYFSGTSMAAPLVTGIASMYLAFNPFAHPKDVREFLLTNASKNQLPTTHFSPNRLAFLPYDDYCPPMNLFEPETLSHFLCEQ